MSTTADNASIGGTLAVTGAAVLSSTLSATTITATSDINAAGGFRSFVGPWTQANCTASQAAVVLPLVGGDADLTGVPMPRAGSVVGVTVACEAARTAGTCTIAPTIGGTAATGLTAVLNGTNTLKAAGTASKDTTGCTFAAGDLIGVKVTTTSDWAAATTPSIAAFVWVEC